MRRWFLSRFYRLGFGSWFGPATQYVDKEACRTSVAGDAVLLLTPAPDAACASSPVGDPTLKSEVDP